MDHLSRLPAMVSTQPGAVAAVTSGPLVWPGRPHSLGATWDGAGVHFALFSEHAESVELCLFDGPDPGREVARLPMREHRHKIWHAYLPEAGPGQLYGYRLHGPYAPLSGHRFNPAKLVLDPYAKAVAGTLVWNDQVFDYRPGPPAAELIPDGRDSATVVPKAVVVDPTFPWADDRPLGTPWNETILYEVHVKGFTARHPAVPPALRGTYAGLTCPAALDHLRGLGVTAVELLPVHHALSEKVLVERGLTNYWGYNSIAFFAPDARYSSAGARGEQVREFKTMVKTLHQAGIEVILDVVYNHTAEGDHRGPTLAFRAIDSSAYYRLRLDDRSRYVDDTGCGNTLNVLHPRTLQLIMDSLRYWVLEMHVDGFRFDLASALVRDVIQQDPVLSQVKLIAEPGGPRRGGYQIENFSVGWAERNGKYRDAVRRYWRGENGQMAELAYRLTGSSDRYQDVGRRPDASINFVTAHDGFTLADLVGYNVKHNEANGQDNRDGADQNLSWNCGVEGPTDDPAVLALREQQVRNFLATLLLSQGVPMLLGGDEIGRTQRGNNNAYCQDNEISWFDWALDEGRRRRLEFTRRLIRLRRQYPELRRRKFSRGRPVGATGMKDLTWVRPDGGAVSEADWRKASLPAFGLRLCGQAVDDVDDHGEPITANTLLVLLNAHPASVDFVLPSAAPGRAWEALVNTAQLDGEGRGVLEGGAKLPLAGRSVVLLRAIGEGGRSPR